MPIIVSKFKERPKLKDTWRAMVLGLLPPLSYPLILILYVFARPVAELIMKSFGVVLLFFTLVSAVVALVYGRMAYIQGERSWALWVGIVPAFLFAVIWVVAFIGSFVKDIVSLFF